MEACTATSRATVILWLMDGVPNEPDDNALMTAYATGDQRAFELLYSRHRAGLYRYILRLLRDRAATDELFQDVWQRVIGARDGWRPSGSFSGWLYQIAHHRINDYWRARRHRPAAPIDAEERVAAIPDQDTPERAVSEFEQRRRLQLALETLPREQREVVALRLEQELTLEEIATITGVGRETVKSRLRYAMDKLRMEMKP